MSLVVVGLGGALGAVSRYLLGGWIQASAGSAFPWGTLVVNVSGSLLFGIAIVVLGAAAETEQARQLITVGFLGAFTTFSTFSYETLDLVRAGAPLRAAAYVTTSVAVGLAAVVAGVAIATALLRGSGT